MKKISLLIAFVAIVSIGYGQGRATTSIQYNMGIPLGNTADYIEETSFRGVVLDIDYFVEDEWTLGFAMGVQTFYQEDGKVSETVGTLTATGERYKYLNSIPLLFTAKYHLNRFGAVTPHAGLGLGLYYMNQTVKFAGLDFESTDWKFGLRPEVGLGFELSPSTDFIVGVTYNAAFNSKDIDGQGYLGIQTGLRFVP